MKSRMQTEFAKHVLGVSVTAMLAACGGGDGPPSQHAAVSNAAAPATATVMSGSTPTPEPVPTQPSTPAAMPKAEPTPEPDTITGKVVDGYLVGATVCVDTLNDGVCDPYDPSAVTDANGQFTIKLPYKGFDPVGATLLAQVTPSTQDLSRPAGFRFPASFTLSQVIQSTAPQVVSPLTTLVHMHMQTGLSHAEASSAVSRQLLGGTRNPNADYIANRDTESATLAMQVVDTLGTFASGGVIDGVTTRNVLNAMTAKGSITVTADDVSAQAKRPVYKQANAFAVLIQKMATLVDYQVPYLNDGPSTPSARPMLVQEATQALSEILRTSREENVSTSSIPRWSDIQYGPGNSGKYNGFIGAYVLRSDAYSLDFVTEPERQTPLVLTATGTTLRARDIYTGITSTHEVRSIDLSGLPLSIAAPAVRGVYDVKAALSKGTFAAGRQGYLLMQKYDMDRVVLPVSTPPCSNPTPHDGYVCSTLPYYYDGSRMILTSGAANTYYTSIQQAIGQTLHGENVGIGQIRISANQQATVDGRAATWSTYPGLVEMIVLDLAPGDSMALAENQVRTQPLALGARLVIARRNGYLQAGWLYPASLVEKKLMLPSMLPKELTDALYAVPGLPRQ
jgi:hypothetical protein